MGLIELGSCIAALVMTFWMVYYVWVYLPSKFERRIRNSVLAFSTAIELRFPAYKGLGDRTAELSKRVAIRLGIDGMRRRDLEMAVRLRDLGLCAIPYQLVNEKPMNEWTLAERATFNRHPEISAAMLELVPSLCHLAGLVRHHHKTYQELLREGIQDLNAHILKVVTDYAYLEREVGALKAQETLQRLSGEHYHPRVVIELMAVLTSNCAGELTPQVAVLS